MIVHGYYADVCLFLRHAIVKIPWEPLRASVRPRVHAAPSVCSPTCVRCMTASRLRREYVRAFTQGDGAPRALPPDARTAYQGGRHTWIGQPRHTRTCAGRAAVVSVHAVRGCIPSQPEGTTTRNEARVGAASVIACPVRRVGSAGRGVSEWTCGTTASRVRSQRPCRSVRYVHAESEGVEAGERRVMSCVPSEACDAPPIVTSPSCSRHHTSRGRGRRSPRDRAGIRARVATRVEPALASQQGGGGGDAAPSPGASDRDENRATRVSCGGTVWWLGLRLRHASRYRRAPALYLTRLETASRDCRRCARVALEHPHAGETEQGPRSSPHLTPRSGAGAAGAGRNVMTLRP